MCTVPESGSPFTFPPFGPRFFSFFLFYRRFFCRLLFKDYDPTHFFPFSSNMPKHVCPAFFTFSVFFGRGLACPLHFSLPNLNRLLRFPLGLLLHWALSETPSSNSPLFSVFTSFPQTVAPCLSVMTLHGCFPIPLSSREDPKGVFFPLFWSPCRWQPSFFICHAPPPVEFCTFPRDVELRVSFSLSPFLVVGMIVLFSVFFFHFGERFLLGTI